MKTRYENFHRRYSIFFFLLFMPFAATNLPAQSSTIFSDDFNAGALDLNKWLQGSNPGNQANVVNNALQLSSQSGATGWIITKNPYPARHTTVSVKVVQPNEDGDLGISPTYTASATNGIMGQNNCYRFYTYRSSGAGPYRLYAQSKKNGVINEFDVTGNLTITSLSGVYLRFRFDDASIHFEASLDGVAWTDTYTEVFSLPGYTLDSSFYYELAAYNTPGNGTLTVDDFALTSNGGTSDTQPPTISGVATQNITSAGAQIIWQTDEPADSQVEYGLTTSYGLLSPLDPLLFTSHAVTLANLQANTTYHYRVKSKDAAGNLATSDDFTFTTLAASATIFADDFNAGTLDLNKWLKGSNPGNQANVVNNALQLISQSGATGWIITKNPYPARNTVVSVKVVQPNEDGDLGISPTYAQSAANGILGQNNCYRFYTYRGSGAGPYRLYAQSKKNGVINEFDVTGNLVITSTIYLRLRFDDSSIHFEDSLDGAAWTDTYTEVFSLPGYTLDSSFYYELAAYNTPGNGALTVDDFAITSSGGTSDTQPPVISGVAAQNISNTSAQIIWQTDELADSQVEYGLTTNYGSISPLDPAFLTSHAVTLVNLQTNATYHYRVKSKDLVGNLAVSADNVFATSASGQGNVAFANVQGIFDKQCVRCHQGVSAPAGLVLLAGQAHGNIVNVPSVEYPPWLRVQPGNRANSWLYEKITNPTPPVGSKMGSLTADEIDLIGNWIDQGATQTPSPPYADLQFRTTSVVNGEVEIAYSVSLVVWGGLPPYQFSLVSGSLPFGLALDPTTGTIAGVPTSPGSHVFTIRVSDSQAPAATLEQTYSMQVFDTQDHWQVASGFLIENVVSGLHLPVNIAFVPNPGPNPGDPYFYVTLLYGEIVMVQRDFQKQTYASGLLNFVPTASFPGSGEKGVTGITVDPVSGDVFASMVYDDGGSTFFDKVVRFHSTDGGRTAATQTTLLSGIPAGTSHQIQALTIGPDGKLYVNVGDGWVASAAPDLNDLRGKILRLNLDGSIPPDNPFPNNYVYASGLRNPFGAAWRPADSKLYISDNGPEYDDRLAKILAGADYGWNLISPNLAQGAIYLWNPTVSPVGMDFINKAPFPTPYRGQLFVGRAGLPYDLGYSVVGKKIQRFVLDSAGNVASDSLFLDYVGVGRATVIGVAEGLDGLYFTDLFGENGFDQFGQTQGNVYRLRWAAADVTPPAISNVQATNVTGTSATIVWQTDEPATRQVEYGLTSNYGLGSPYETNLLTNHSVTLSQLLPETTYHFRVFSADASNNGIFSSDFTFATTVIDSVAPAISNVRFDNISATSALILWDTDEPANSFVDFGTTANYGLVQSDAQLVTQHSIGLTGLSGNTLYHFRVRSQDASANEAASGDNTFTTLPTPVTIFADDFNGGALDLNKWLPGSNPGNQADVINNALQISSPSGATGWVVTKNPYAARNTTVSVKVVQPNDDGDLGVSPTYTPSATNGISGQANWYRFYVYRDNRTGPYELYVQSKKNGVLNELEVTGNLMITGTVYLRLRFDDANIHFEASLDGLAWTDTYAEAFSLPGYTLDSSFYYELAAYSTPGNGVLIVDDVAITSGGGTSDTQPPLISAVAAQNITSTGAQIVWQTDEPADSQVEYGLTTSYGASTPLDPALATSHAVTLSGLQANAIYHYRVKSKDAAGNLAMSGDFTFSTTAPSNTIFSDDFNAGALDLNKWLKGSNPGNQANVINNALQLSSQSAATGWIITKNPYAARNTAVSVKVVQPNNDGDLGMSPTFTPSATNGIFGQANFYRFYTYRSSGSGPYHLYAQWKKNGVAGELDVTGNLVITGSIYLRLRFDDSNIHFEASFDGAAWIGAYSEAFGLPGYTLDSSFYYELAAYNTPAKGVLTVDDFAITTIPPGGTDTQPPMISGVAAQNITSTGAQIVWQTNEPADSQVEYGLTASYGSNSPLDPLLLTSHVVTLANLQTNTTYHYRVKSKDAAGNLAVSNDAIFTTAGTGSAGNVAFVNVQGIFDRNCVRCHQGAQPPAGLVLSSGQAYGNIVNVPSTEYPQWMRVQPNNRAVSWLYEKITNQNPAVGSKMENLSADEIALIGAWIDQGAAAVPSPPYVDLEFRTASLPPAEVNITYNVEIVVWGGLPPYQFSVGNGSLPPGLNLNSSSGKITGAPNTAGTYSFTIQVRDSQSPNATLNQAYSIVVNNSQAHWQVQAASFRIQPVVSDLDLPVNIAFVPNPGPNPADPYFYVTLLYGSIVMVQRDFQTVTYAGNLLNFDPRAEPSFQELGVVGILVEPSSGDLFASLAYDSLGLKYGKVVRFHSTDGGRTAATQTTIFSGIPIANSHQVHALTIGPDGKLYLNSGDGFVPSAAPNINDPRGKILRMNLDGTLPADNPFPNNYTYASGLRNPFGAVWRPSDNRLYISDNGPGYDDRIIKVTAGSDYGWPSDLTIGALYLWNPTVSPVGVDFLQNTPFPSTYAGQFFVAQGGPTYLQGTTTRGKEIQAFQLDSNGNVVSVSTFLEYIGAGYGTVIGLKFGPDGLYFTDIYGENGFDGAGIAHGNVYRIQWDVNDTAPPVISNVQATNVKATTATIVWQTDEPAKRQVEYGLTTNYGNWTPYETNLLTNHSVTLSQLLPETTYHFRVWNWDAADNSAVSADFTFTTITNDTIPPVISNVRLDSVSANSALVLWSTNEPASSFVDFGLTANYGFLQADSQLVTAHRIWLTGLADSTLYHFRVRSRDYFDNESVSGDSAFTTQPSDTLLADNFDGATLNMLNWQLGASAGNLSRVANNALELKSQGAETGWVITRNAYSARNTTVSVKVVQPNDDGDIGLSPTYSLSATNGIFSQPNWYRFYTYRSSSAGPYHLYVQWKKNGVLNEIDVTGNLVITGTLYLRLRFDDTNIHFEASLNGAAWTDTYTEAFGLPGYTLDSAFHYELAGYHTGANGVLIVDDFAITRNSAATVTKPNSATPMAVLLPEKFALQNYPNPFNAGTRIQFALPKAAEIEIKVFDMSGREVGELASGTRPAGSHEVIWNGRAPAWRGNELSSGIYFVRLRYRTEKIGSWSQLVRRILLVK
jgi:glucose/arabinose dehydrogenase/phosphodiesterase/alkaline phosphatase D-like protein